VKATGDVPQLRVAEKGVIEKVVEVPGAK